MHVQDLEQLLNLSIQPQPEIEPETIARIFSEIQSVHAGLVEDGTVMRVLSYCARIMTELLQAQMQLDEESRTYISPRTYARSFPETILAVAAYHIVAGTTEPLQTAASDAVRYCLATKYRLNDGYLEQLHQTARGLLQGGAISEAEQMRFAIASLRSFEERLAYLQDNRERIAANLKADELEKFLGTMLQGASAEGEKEKLVHLRKELDEVGYTGDILRQVDGNLILTLNSAISTFFPILNQLKIKQESWCYRQYCCSCCRGYLHRTCCR